MAIFGRGYATTSYTGCEISAFGPLPRSQGYRETAHLFMLDLRSPPGQSYGLFIDTSTSLGHYGMQSSLAKLLLGETTNAFHPFIVRSATYGSRCVAGPKLIPL